MKSFYIVFQNTYQRRILGNGKLNIHIYYSSINSTTNSDSNTPFMRLTQILFVKVISEWFCQWWLSVLHLCYFADHLWIIKSLWSWAYRKSLHSTVVYINTMYYTHKYTCSLPNCYYLMLHRTSLCIIK